MFVKVCGITRAEDARLAIDAGATALGFVFWPRSPRRVEPKVAAAIMADLPSNVLTVGVFVDETEAGVATIAEETGVGAIQFHGSEGPSFAVPSGRRVVRSATLDTFASAADAWPDTATFLLDAADHVRKGGTGVRVDWTRAAALAARRPTILAGGLTPENVAEAVATVRPYGVDVSSGVETAPGVKDPDKLRRFVANARAAFERM